MKAPRHSVRPAALRAPQPGSFATTPLPLALGVRPGGKRTRAPAARALVGSVDDWPLATVTTRETRGEAPAGSRLRT